MQVRFRTSFRGPQAKRRSQLLQILQVPSAALFETISMHQAIASKLERQEASNSLNFYFNRRLTVFDE